MRSRLVALVVASVAAAGLVAVALLTGGSQAGSCRGLRIDRGTIANSDDADLIVYVEGRNANVPSTAGGRATVELQCLDRAGRPVVRAVFPWPFVQTDDGLNGTDPVLQGRLGAARAR